ncbi:hypothetical protein [Amycolatopsis azurea]|uniref:Uncharacterized protein n=1 Tax=Amycolatopsis azurea DSM 43854 TaxID=1238180 RepID=M2QMW7_9PSEU|nr:hypothetical protein [Amycolatopsis azurea]EMD28016.1 hypothetical protein C791_1468 [Amycolatopsis azurea DSM 43854]OOC05387.1 hypothetical protein B0293_18290 [Amycolatopsis azurea DSM 43854]
MVQPQGDQGFNVDPVQIDEHAKQVATTLETIQTALAADQQSRIQAGDFGLIGQLVALDVWCSSTADKAAEALKSAVDAGEHHVSTVRKWAQARRVDEESATELINRAGQVKHG